MLPFVSYLANGTAWIITVLSMVVMVLTPFVYWPFRGPEAGLGAALTLLTRAHAGHIILVAAAIWLAADALEYWLAHRIRR